MRKVEVRVEMNIVPMIDVIFQLFIFFICTLNLQDTQLSSDIELAMAPHGAPVEQVDPRTIHIEVDAAGRVYIAKTRLSIDTLRRVLKKAVAEYGGHVPVVVRGDAGVLHGEIKAVLDACTEAGLSDIMFAAIKEKQG